MVNGLPRFILAVVVAAFYAFYVAKALKTGRARRYFGRWMSASEDPASFYSSIAISAGLGLFALYVAIRSGRVLFGG